MNDGEEPDGVVVPMKRANKATAKQAEAAEFLEGRTQGEHQSVHLPLAQNGIRQETGAEGCAPSRTRVRVDAIIRGRSRMR